MVLTDTRGENRMQCSWGAFLPNLGSLVYRQKGESCATGFPSPCSSLIISYAQK